jgi:hypothetical protein
VLQMFKNSEMQQSTNSLPMMKIKQDKSLILISSFLQWHIPSTLHLKTKKKMSMKWCRNITL